MNWALKQQCLFRAKHPCSSPWVRMAAHFTLAKALSHATKVTCPFIKPLQLQILKGLGSTAQSKRNTSVTNWYNDPCNWRSGSLCGFRCEESSSTLEAQDDSMVLEWIILGGFWHNIICHVGDRYIHDPKYQIGYKCNVYQISTLYGETLLLLHAFPFSN